MSFNNNDQELIDAYLRMQLSPDQTEAFNKRKEDPDFKNLLKENQEIFNSIDSSGKKAIKEDLQKLESRLESVPKKNNVFTIRSIGLAAASVVLVGFLVWMFKPSQDYTQLYAKYHEPFPNLVDPITKGEDESLRSGYRLYEIGKYKEAIDLFESNLNPTAENLFYHGLSYIELNDCLNAEQVFNRIDANNQSFIEMSKWYMGLCVLPENPDKSKLILQELSSNTNHPYHQECLNLLLDLK